jgi:hypothetical protein
MDPAVRALLEKREEKKWGSFSWTTLRALVSSLNHVLNTGAPALVPDIRAAWMGRAGPPDVIDRAADTAFIVLGDPGEQDESQYVVVPPLLKAAAGEAVPAFMVICSDVIYPSGDVNDYVDGFYVPYRELEDATGQLLPVYALPGNHDWYDGLSGFMWHFCRDDEPLPATVYGGRGSPVEWVLRLLWRRPSNRKSQLRLEERRDARFPTPLQRTPYFAIDTKHVRLVCIDTGIDGRIDRDQAEWLVEVSADPAGGRPKVLLTGKPLLVDRRRHTGPLPDGVAGANGGPAFGSVDEIVRCPEHRYVASIGGDIHNFQHYEDEGSTQPFHYVVSGGGGAYMSATHPLAITGPDEGATDDPPEPVGLYPNEAESLRHFARLVLPRVWRLFRALALVVLGIAGAAAWIGLADDEDMKQTVLQWTATGVGAWFLARSLVPDQLRRTRGFRFVVCAVSLAAGVAIGLAGWWLAPEEFATSFRLWFGLTAAGIAVAVVVRLTHWWRGRDPGWHVSGWWLIPLGVTLVAVTWWTVSIHEWAGATAAIVTAIIAASTWLLRGTERWSPAIAVAVATVVQLGDALVVLAAAVPDTALGAVWATVAGVAAGALLTAATAFVLLPALAYVVATLFWFGAVGEGWGRIGGAAQAVLPFLAAGVLAGVAALLHPELGRDPWRAAVVGAVTLPVIVGAVFLVDWARRHARWSVSEVDAAGAAVAAFVLLRADVVAGFEAGLAVFAGAVGAVLGAGWLRGRRRLRAHAFKLDVVVLVGAALAVCWSYGVHETWVPRAAAAAVVVLAATVVSVALAHLFFIGVPETAIDLPCHRDGEPLTPEDAQRILQWRRTEPGRAYRPSWRVRLRANVVFPGVHRASGPLQQKVAEVFDSDDPPFAKNFLVVTTTAEELTIRMQPVTGTEEDPDPYPIHIPLSHGAPGG